MTLVTLALIYAYFTRPTAPRTKVYAISRSIILMFAAVPIAILTNAVRVSGTGVLAHYYGTKVADGFFHSFSGWVIYIAAAALLFATGWAVDTFGRTWIHKTKPSLEAALVPPASGQVPTLNL